MKAVLLLLLIIAAVSWFSRNVLKLVKLVTQGQPDARFDRYPERAMNVFTNVFLHQRMMNRPDIGFAHLIFFYGFLIIQVCAIEIFLQGFFPHFSYSFLGPLFPLIMLAQDLLCMGVFLALIYASYRRVIIRPKHLMLTKDAWIINGLIFGVVSTIYLLGATDINLGHREGLNTARFMPFEHMLAGMLSGMSEGAQTVLREASWWLHILIVLGFLNYLPYSKHLHLLGGIPNIFFAKLDRHAALSTPDLEREDLEIFGASEPAHFTWKHLLDTTACTECGRCTSVCPANATGKPLSPMKIIHDLKLAMFDTKDAVLGVEGAAEAERTPLIGGYTSHDELWACTTCGGCVGVCPLLIEHVDDIVDMRRNLVLMESNFPEELQPMFTALENEGNPWGVSSGDRTKWLDKHKDVKVLKPGEKTKLLYWVGCAGAIDDRARKVTDSMIKILKESGTDFAVLGSEESCTGDPARRAGNEYLYQIIAKQNVENLNSHEITKIVTQCPHCLNTLGNEYPDLGGDYEVVHHSEFIQELLDEGKIKVKADGESKVTFHDPCYLGRWNGVLDEPRDVIEALPGSELVEMERSGKNSFCCGAGGARMWMEEHIGEPVNVVRTAEAIETGADTIAVGCPFCNTMMTDGVKEHGREADVRVKDIAEMIADRLVPSGAKG